MFLWLVYGIVSWILVVVLDSFDKGKVKRDDEIAQQNGYQEVSVVEVGVPIAGPGVTSTAVAGLSVPVHSIGSG